MSNDSEYSKRLVPIAALIIAGMAGAYLLTHQDTTSAPAHSPPVKPPVKPPQGIQMVAISEASGLAAAIHDVGARGRWHMPETVAGGVALIDYDNDGLLDVFLAQSGPVPGSPEHAAALAAGELESLPPRLMRNEGGLRFRDVTREAGLRYCGYGIAVLAADLDGDGHRDLYISGMGPNTFWRNRGDGSFEDATEQAGIGAPGFNASATVADVDGDGDLDLYVTAYSDPYDPGQEPVCYQGAARNYCPPGEYPPARHTFYRNLGNGRFEDVTEAALDPAPVAHGLAAAFVDLDDDGLVDLYVANDIDPNFLYRNRGDGTFEEIGLQAGAAMSSAGSEQGSMGIGIGDINGDSLPDLLVTNFAREDAALYASSSPGLFNEDNRGLGLFEVLHPYVGWSCAFHDLDHDGLLDLYAVNGHVYKGAQRFEPDTATAQPLVFARGTTSGKFVEISRAVLGRSFRIVGRGAAAGDLDNDGDMDLVVVQRDGPLILLENRGGNRRSWIVVTLRGTDCHWEAIGSVVDVETAAPSPQATARTQRRWRVTSQGFASSEDPRLHWGLGDSEEVSRVVVRWPCGRQEAYGPFAARTRLTLVEGAGKTLDQR